MRSHQVGKRFGFGGRNEVELVERDQRRTLDHRGVESLDFAAHRREVVFRICGNVKHIDQDAGALQMAQESDPEAEALVSAFDQPGNIGDIEAVFLGDSHAAQVRRERGERVGAIFGRAAVSAASRVDLPALGSPTRPASATRRNSSRTER